MPSWPQIVETTRLAVVVGWQPALVSTLFLVGILWMKSALTPRTVVVGVEPSEGVPQSVYQ